MQISSRFFVAGSTLTALSLLALTAYMTSLHQTYLGASSAPLREEHIEQLFHRMDVDGDLSLTADELETHVRQWPGMAASVGTLRIRAPFGI